MKANIVIPRCIPTNTHTTRSPTQAIAITNNNVNNLTWTIRGVVGEKETWNKESEEKK